MNRIEVVVRDIIDETADAYSLVLESHPELCSYEAGQFVNVYRMIGHHEIERSYSFSSAPLADKNPVITIKKVPIGLVSNQIKATLRPGNKLLVSKPLGRFTLNEELAINNVIFIAGGSGITPIFGMLKEGIKRSTDVNFILLYANRDQQIIFRDKINEIENDHRNRLIVHYFIEEGGDSKMERAKIHNGRINKGFLNDILYGKEQLFYNSKIYICGPEAMMTNILNWLDELKYDQKLIHTEHFFNSKKSEIPISQGEKESTIVAIHNLKGWGIITLKVSRKSDILSQFLANGYDLPHSCREAMCGSCAIKLKKGEVTMQENYALSDSKLNEGYVLLCQSFPISAELILEYDLQDKTS